MANEYNITMTAKDLASGKIKGLGDEAKTSMDKLRDMRKQFLAVGAAGAAVVGTLAMFTKSALDQQIGVNLLDNALRNIGKSYGDEKDAIEAVISSIQAKTNFGDEEQRTSLTQLIALTGDYETSLDALSVATDLAAGLGLDFNSASQLLAKVLAGNTSMLSRYGITIDSSASKTEILQTITEKFGGSAEAAKDPMTQLNNSLGDLAQVVGNVLLPILEAILPPMKTITEAISSFAEKNPLLTQTLVIMAATLGSLAVVLGTVGVALPIAATMMAGLGTATAGTALAFVGFNVATGGILIAIGLVIAGIVALIQNWDAVVRAVKIGANALATAFEFFFKEVLLFYVNNAIRAFNLLAGVFGEKIDLIEIDIKRFDTSVEKSAEVVDESSKQIGQSLGVMQDDFTQTADVAEDAYERMGDASIKAAEDIISAKSEEVARFIEFSKLATDETNRRAALEELEAQESMARAMEEAETIVAASNDRYAKLKEQRWQNVEDEAAANAEILSEEEEFNKKRLAGIESFWTLKAAKSKEEFDRLADQMMALPSVIPAGGMAGGSRPDIAFAMRAFKDSQNDVSDALAEAQARVASGDFAEFGVLSEKNTLEEIARLTALMGTDQFKGGALGALVGEARGGFGGAPPMLPGMKAPERFVRGEQGMQKERLGQGGWTVVIEGDVYGVDELVAKVSDANTQAAQLGMN
jgi:hypothetical protein